MAHHARKGNHVPAERVASEHLLGITERTSPIDFGWGADIRKRYTDFLVYEVGKDGTVRHLNDFEEREAPKQANNEPSQRAPSQRAPSTIQPAAQKENTPAVVQPIIEADRIILEQLLGKDAATQLVELDEAVQAKKPIDSKSPPLILGVISDRQKRGSIHQEIRRIFSSRIETSTDNGGNMTAVPFKPMSSNWRGQFQGQGRRTDNRNPQNDSRRDTNRNNNYKSFAQLGGEYLQCTLYKENKDTMDALNLIARMLKIKVSNFGFSGTKDRRAATVQRISIQRQRDTNIIWLNTRLQGIKLGDFKYSKHPIQLGQHGGNEFVITLKNVEHSRGANCSTPVRLKMIRQSVHIGLRHLSDCGFINYFGLQRFGTHNIGTHELGIRILQGDFEGAVNDILFVEKELAQAAQGITPVHHHHHQGMDQNGHNQGADDQMNRARALGLWFMTKDSATALEILPKRFSAETSIIKHLGRTGQQRDYMGALLTITRGLRMMYIHAYQSYVWNHIASYRWAKYGTQVIPGDLILLDTQHQARTGGADDDIPDMNGEWEAFYAQVQVLSAEDIASGKHTIFDVVLPQPGYDITYPENDIGEYYKTFMHSEKGGHLDPYDMRRPQREFSMSGGYRHFIGTFITKPEYLVRTYSDDNEQMYPTDLDLIMQRKAEEAKAKKLERAAKAPRVANWNDFAKNSKSYDAAEDAELKRRRSEEPAPPVVLVNETWVQTTHDGSLKRAKIAKHHNTEVHDNDTDIKMEDVKLEAEDVKLEDQFPLPTTPAVASANELSGQEFLLKRLQEAAGQTPESQATRSGTPMTTGLSPCGQDDGTSTLSNNNNGSSAAAAASQTTLKPEFESIDADVMSKFSPANYVYDEKVDGDKIAVVLKFQLRSSSYATIVLRELMGTLEGEGKTLSR
ncbi:pseudouridine synthase [Coniochaeta ligniaria NRRL 30616]|uniref:Pseudouridine synthase n=1 Tax=Coniochaeta ligniaria NRRL 30616 TaxID=1408157 RepID=A0A1J7JV84_9PEZI|nr:pseudouridine synthase [Coniochaeta ligniaria NRRL 30616]